MTVGYGHRHSTTIQATGRSPASSGPSQPGAETAPPCELCHGAPARERGPNPAAYQDVRPMCRRCGAKVRDFNFRAKALEGKLLEQRARRLEYVGTVAGYTRSGIPTKKQIRMGLITMNAAWMCAVAARTQPNEFVQTFTRSDLTGICGSLCEYDSTRRILRQLASDGVLVGITVEASDEKTASDSAPSHPDPAHTASAPRPDRGGVYTLDDGAWPKIAALLSACEQLRVDAHYYLEDHLRDVLSYMRTGAHGVPRH